MARARFLEQERCECVRVYTAMVHLQRLVAGALERPSTDTIRRERLQALALGRSSCENGTLARQLCEVGDLVVEPTSVEAPVSSSCVLC